GGAALRRYFVPSAPSTAERTIVRMPSTKMRVSNAAARRSHDARMRSRSATVVEEIAEARAAAVGGTSHPVSPGTIVSRHAPSSTGTTALAVAIALTGLSPQSSSSVVAML